MTVFLPLLLPGNNRQPRSKSMRSHPKCKISRRRRPVKRNNCSAAAADGAILVDHLAFGKCLALGFDLSTVQGMPVVSTYGEIATVRLQGTDDLLGNSLDGHELARDVKSFGAKACNK
jgi:hypothetical protein